MSSVTVPSKLDEKMLYIWKIIDRKSIDWRELVYYIAFDLHLTTPANAKAEVLEAVKQGILKATSDFQLSLNKDLEMKFEEFQKQGVLKYRKMLGRLKDSWGSGPAYLQSKGSRISQAESQKILEQTSESAQASQPEATSPKNLASNEIKIDKLLEQLTVKTTVQTGLKINDSDITFETLNFDTGIISGKTKGSEGTPYIFLIDTQTKILSHNCVDFSMKRARKKEICKHLVKVFELLIKNPNENGKKIVEQIIADKLNWNFKG
jgi:hypothetical protein